MKVSSPEFEHNSSIPKKFTCQGDDVNPALIIEGVPANTKTLALIVDDPDAPMGTWVHWVAYNIPVVSAIDEESIPGKQAMNDLAGGTMVGLARPQARTVIFLKYMHWIPN